MIMDVLPCNRAKFSPDSCLWCTRGLDTVNSRKRSDHDHNQLTFEFEQFHIAIDRFIRIWEGRNRRRQTLRAYLSDLSQLAGWLHNDHPLLTDPVEVTTDDLNEFLATLAHRRVSSVSRAGSWRQSVSSIVLEKPLANVRSTSLVDRVLASGTRLLNLLQPPTP